VEIQCIEILFPVQFCISFSPLFSAVEILHFLGDPECLDTAWEDGIDNFQLLETLRLFFFGCEESLSLQGKYTNHVPVMQDLDGTGSTEVLPTLQNIFLDGLQQSRPIEEDIGRSVAARQRSGRTITVSL